MAEERKEIKQKRDDWVKDWGLQSEESRKIFEARFNKQMQRKNKKVVMNAD